MFVVKNESSNNKSQVITFDALARITGSCNTLFDAAQVSDVDYNRMKPYLLKVINYLNAPTNTGVPLFFPKIAFECAGFKGRCDFTFVRSSDIYGNITITCLISDNPTRRFKPRAAQSKKDQGSERISA
jgi:hypothetical protein